MALPAMRSKRVITNLERHLKWEKKRQEVAVSAVILQAAVPIAQRLIQLGMEGNPTALNSLLDRVFGKARQNIGLDGGATDKPIVFMPAQLMSKYAITPAEYTELDAPQDATLEASATEITPPPEHIDTEQSDEYREVTLGDLGIEVDED